MFEKLEELEEDLNEVELENKSANIQMIEYKLGVHYTDEQIRFAETFDKDIISNSLPGVGKTSAAVFKLVLAQMDGVFRGEEMTAMSFTRAATGHLKRKHLDACEALRLNQTVKFPTLLGLCYKLIADNYELLGLEYFTKASSMSYEDTCNYLLGAGKDNNINVTKKNVGAIRAAIMDANSSLIFDPKHLKVRESFVRCGLSIGDFSVLRKCLYELNRSVNRVDVKCLALYALELLLKHPEIGEKEREKRKFLLCDEAQDLSLLLLKLLSMVTQKLCLIGDINQQIYGFNGACAKIVDEFKELYPNHAELNLTQSFRCGEAIVKYAKNVIAPNGNTAEEFKGVEGRESSVSVIRDVNIQDVADIVLKDYDKDNERFSKDIMFLYRNNVSAIPVYEALYTRGIPFTGDKFIKATDIPVISDLMALIELARHASDPKYLWILKKLLPEFYKYNTVDEMPLAIAMKQEQSSVLEVNYSFKDEYAGTKIMEALIDVKQLLRERKPVRDIFNRLWGVYDAVYLTDNSYKFERDPIYYVKLIKDLTHKTYKKFVDDEEEKYKSYIDSTRRHMGVGCYTLHGAKGLEADDVYILEAEEGVIPNEDALQSAIDHNCILDAADAVRNERSLIFVGITRAKHNCYICYQNSLSPIVTGSPKYADLDRAYRSCNVKYNDIPAFIRFISFNITEDDYLDKLQAYAEEVSRDESYTGI